MYILQYTARQHDINGRKEISAQVKQTIDKISDKDERSFFSKGLDREKISRKEELTKVLAEIEQRTKMTKAEYEEKWEKEVREESERRIKEAVEKIVKERQFNN